MEEKSECFECLQLRINTDFSDQLVFNHAISTSAFPFGSSAIVHISGTAGGETSDGQFILQYMPSHEKNCFTNYVNEYILDSSESSISNDADIGGSQYNNVVNGETRNASCNHSGRFSCSRTITSLAQIARVGMSSYSTFQEVATDFSSGLIEDHVLDSLDLFIEGKASGRDSINFLSLLGLPSFKEDTFPGTLRHPNVAPVLAIFKTSDHINMVLPKTPYNLESILHFNPNALKSDWNRRFLIYQLLSALLYLHGLGLSHGNICPSNIMVTDSLWSWLRLWNEPALESNLTLQKSESINSKPAKIGCSNGGCHSNGLYADLKLSPSIDWHSSFHQWWRGELSNFEYLLILNRLAGRRWGDHTFHPVMPWVINFSSKPDDNCDAGWRDLSKSKWRLAKGDEQLDFTYSTSEIPHHVSDECLSELAVCSYKARRLPLSVLRMAVRSVYEPNEYPSTMQRLYQWTPDECIPEFYCDAQIFRSIHDGMADLAVPSWAESPEDFIKLHRDALESNRVSFQLHHWIDITFGYKMSGQAAIAAKNVMLPLSEPMMPRSAGRRQLFTRPHPIRYATTRITRNGTNKYTKVWSQTNEMERETSLLSETAYLQELEQASAFAEHARHLNACYHYPLNQTERNISSSGDPTTETFTRSIGKLSLIDRNHRVPYKMNLISFLQQLKEEDEGFSGYPDLLLWKQKLSSSRVGSEDVAKDIFSVGCLLAELHLCRPLFDSISLAIYLEDGTLPGFLQELPPHVRLLVEACIQKDWMRRPSAKILLESPYFSKIVKSSYLFLAPLQLVAKHETRLRYAANLAKQGALREMGAVAAEICATYCLPLVLNSVNDIEAEWAYILLKEFMKCLTTQAVKTLILPAIQKILQTTGYLHLKVSLLQDSFVREIWNQVGKQAYLETIHPLVLSNLYISPDKSSAASASVLLIGSSEEIGVPITIHQTILPLVHCFGKGLCADGIDVLVRIGGIFGESFIVKQMLPLLKNVFRSFIDVSCMNKPDPVQSWSALALIDCMMTLDGLVAFLTEEVIVKELLEDLSSMHIGVLTQKQMEIAVLQVAASTLFGICQRIGADLTALHILPKLKELFDELAFSQEISKGSTTVGRNLKVDKLRIGGHLQIESRMDLVLVLYPSFASLLGIEKLRQCCATWLLLEQFLLRNHNWKWEYAGESSKNGSENIIGRRPMTQGFTSEYNPAKLLLNGVGWSIPQSQGSRSAKNLIPQRRPFKVHQNSVVMHEGRSYQMNHEPWFWFPSPATIWDGPEFLGRVGVQKDDLPWKIRASVIYSIRAHHGAVRSLAVHQDECTVFTAGIGQGYKGTVQKWELSRTNCMFGYYSHEEVVNDICILSSSGRVASCDGTIHIWNSQTGEQISVFAESQTDSGNPTSHPSSASKINSDQANVLNLNTLSNGILSSAFDSSLYTCMHLVDSAETLVVGTGNGSLRFIDVARGQKLHIWRGESNESSFPSLISAICSSGSDKMQAGGISTFSSLIATGLSSGHCKLFDARSGSVIASWRAHDGYVTKLAAPEEHMLVSSSLDRTLRVWDLRMNLPSQPIIFRGHSDAISSFSIWGQDVISISRNRIGLLSLSKSANETDGQHHIIPQKLYASDNGMRSLSALSSISILPFSRLFLIGTEDGYLRICC